MYVQLYMPHMCADDNWLYSDAFKISQAAHSDRLPKSPFRCPL